MPFSQVRRTLLPVLAAGVLVASSPRPLRAEQGEGRLPVPDREGLSRAARTAMEHFGEDYARAQSPAQQLALSRKLLAEARRLESDPAERYVLLVAAIRLAGDAGAVATAMEGVEALAGAFQVNTLELKAKTLGAMLDSGPPAVQARVIAAEACELMQRAGRAAQFETARQLADLAVRAASAAQDETVTAQIDRQLEAIDEALAQRARVQKALARLAEEPTDAAANQLAGEYYCFSQGDWDRGIPMLALGDDAALRALAQEELQAGASAERLAGAADRWWDLAEGREAAPREHLVKHAADLYRKALPGLAAGLTKQRIEQRIASREEPAAPADSATTPEGRRASQRAGEPLACRARKAELIRSGGGTAESERAVALALRWLAEHQMPDGGWNFNHATHPKCRGQCRNAGTEVVARNGATAMALLPFLGAGQTHKAGNYKKTVKEGLYFLVSRMQVGPTGGSLYETGKGRMYAHGLASIVLCEACAMTGDKGLHIPAQHTINFIAYAQDPVGGGWRYAPRQKGDTSVTGWQFAALHAAQLAHLKVPPLTLRKAYGFLDVVQANGGANYGYTDPGAGQATTSIGLLARMHQGWKEDNPALKRGVTWVSRKGPSIRDSGSANMYYNYYATQLLWQWGGEEWTRWNATMRDALVESQAQEGHEQGSWHFSGEHGSDVGGRLYITALAALTLEVYYRYPRIDAP